MARRYWILVVRVAVAVLAIAAWHWASKTKTINPFLFSNPAAVADGVIEWFASGFIWKHLAITLYEAALGYLIATLLGLASGLLLATNKALTRVVEPLLVLANAVPRFALAPLFILWFGLGPGPKVMLVVVVCYFIVFFNVFNGVRSIPAETLNNLRLLGASPRELVADLYLPAAFGWVMSALRTSVGMALASAVASEYLGSDAGLGYLVEYRRAMLDMPSVWSALFILVCLVALADTGLRWVERRFTLWRL